MASKVPDEAPHSETEDENPVLRLKKKRGRRVSFADTEITSVHIFRRDDDYETPPDSKPSSATSDAESQPDNAVLGFFGDLNGGGGDSDDSGDENGGVDGRKSFLRPMGSPSPGSSSAGSATSNDEDNFFGPVSASFIRPGRLSDSAASDEIHEETLDTTAFSMHYRSLARSDSGEPKTPTAVRLVFEDKTKTKDPYPSDSGSFMALTEPKRLSSQSPVAIDKHRGGVVSDEDMSIVDEESKRYDYGALSPTLDALLAEGSKDLTNTAGASNHQVRSPNQLLSGSKKVGEDATSAYQHLNESSVRENSPDVGRKDTDQTSNKRHGSLLEGSPITSARQQQSILNTPNSARISDIVSPSSKQAEVQSNERMKLGERILSIEKSISRFKTLDTSYSGSSTKQGIDKLKQRLSKYSSISSPFTSSLGENSKELQFKYGSMPIACLEKQLVTADAKNEVDASLVNVEIDQVETPRNTSKLGQKKEITGVAKDVQPPNSMSRDVLSKDRPVRITTSGSSPFGLSSSVAKVRQQALISEGSSKNMFTSGTDSLLVNDAEVSFPHMHIESESLSSFQSPGDKAILNFQESSENNLQTGKSASLATSYVIGTIAESPIIMSPSIKESTQSPIRKMPTQSPAGKTPNQEASWRESTENRFKKSPIERRLPTRSPLMKDLTPRSLMKELTPRSHMNMPNQRSPAKELTQIFPRKGPLQSPRVKEPSGYETIHSPSRLDPAVATHGANMQSFPEKDMASTSTDLGRLGSDNFQQGKISQSPLFPKAIEISSERKKRSIGVVFEDGKHTYKTPRMQESSDAYKSGTSYSDLIYSQSNKVLSETENTVGDRTKKHWLDIWATFSKDAEQLLPPSINELNLKAIDTLEDILTRLFKVKKYEILASKLQSQKVSDCFGLGHNKRVAEIRFLLHKIACEKAKRQLMGVKHEKLLKRVELLKSGIQECKMLKLNYSQLSKSSRSDTKLDGSHLQSCTVNLESEHQVVNDTVSTMKQEVKELDRKINSLCNFFHSRCKSRLGDPSSSDTVVLVYDDLKRRNCCRLLRQELQLWKVESFQYQSGAYTIVLNYQDYLSQRFTVDSGPMLSVIISNQLNERNIVKTFPNMDVQVAFAFVLNAEVNKTGVDSKCFAQETQVTQSLLRNLLDIVEEVQMAQIEIGILVEANFHSPSDQQLSLQLCFIHFYTGIKVTLALDVTCLNSGVYPLEILPCQIQTPQKVTQRAKSLLGEIRSAAENLEVGYSRILRLCRCVAQVLRASSS